MSEMTDRDRELFEQTSKRADKRLKEYGDHGPHPSEEAGWYEIVRDEWIKTIAAAREEGRQEERALWMECAKYDATVPKPLFRAWDRSGLDRLRKKSEHDDAP